VVGAGPFWVSVECDMNVWSCIGLKSLAGEKRIDIQALLTVGSSRNKNHEDFRISYI
jgi:hypothetical protein